MGAAAASVLDVSIANIDILAVVFTSKKSFKRKTKSESLNSRKSMMTLLPFLGLDCGATTWSPTEANIYAVEIHTTTHNTRYG